MDTDVNNTALVLFAALSPLLIALIKQQGFSRQVNAMIALACYVVVGLLGALLSGLPLTIENAVRLIATVTVVGSSAYQIIWSNLGTSDDEYDRSIDERLTAATSFIK
jgi:hypothetical protein